MVHFTNPEVVGWLADFVLPLETPKRKDLAIIEMQRECLKALSPISGTKDKDKKVVRSVTSIKAELTTFLFVKRNYEEALLMLRENYQDVLDAFRPDD